MTLVRLAVAGALLFSQPLVVASHAGCGSRFVRHYGCSPTYVTPAPIKQFLLQEHQYYQLLGQLRQPTYLPPGVMPPGQSTAYPQPQPGQPGAQQGYAQYPQGTNVNVNYAQPQAAPDPAGEVRVRDFFAIMRENSDMINLNGVRPAPTSPPRLNPPPGADPAAPPQPQPPGQPQPQPPEQPPAPGGDELSQLDAQVRAYVTKNCMGSCHVGAESPRFSLEPSILVDFGKPEVIDQLACVITTEVLSGHMPKGGPQATDEECGMLLRWERAKRLSAAQQSKQAPVPSQGR